MQNKKILLLLLVIICLTGIVSASNINDTSTSVAVSNNTVDSDNGNTIQDSNLIESESSNNKNKLNLINNSKSDIVKSSDTSMSSVNETSDNKDNNYQETNNYQINDNITGTSEDVNISTTFYDENNTSLTDPTNSSSVMTVVNSQNNDIYVDANNGSDFGTGTINSPFQSLNRALTYYRYNTTNNIYLSNGTYSLNSTYTLNKALNITGQSKETTIINCNNHRGFIISNTTVLLNNISINKGSLISGSSNGGGAIFANTNVTLIINNCNFRNNTAINFGGAIFSTGKNNNINISNSEFRDNHAPRAGAIHTGGAYSKYYIYNCTFINNYANSTDSTGSSASGGVIYSGSFSNLTIDHCNFQGNGAIQGSVIYNGNKAELTVLNSNFTNNKPHYEISNKTYGGAIMIASGNGYIKNSIFRNNTAYYAGAISINSGEIINITNGSFINNVAKHQGGAIYDFGELTIANSKFINNSAGSLGGAILEKGSYHDSILNTQFINNKADLKDKEKKGRGGAISANGQFSEWVLTNVLFNNNSGIRGGAIDSGFNIYSWDLLNNTIINNQAINGAGIYISSNNTDLKINKSYITSNTVTNNGGAIYLDGSHSHVSIINTRILNNKAINATNITEGGAIYINKDLVLRIENVRLFNNSADYGAAIFTNSSTTLKVYKVSFINNTAINGSALYISNINTTGINTDIELRSCTIYNNTGTSLYSNTKYNDSTNLINARYNWWGSNDGNKTAQSNVDAGCPMVLLFAPTGLQWNNSVDYDFILDISKYNKTGISLCDFKLPTKNIIITLYDQNNNTNTTSYLLFSRDYITIPAGTQKISIKLDNQEIIYTPNTKKEAYITSDNITVNPGTTMKFTATIHDADDKAVENATVSVTSNMVSITNITFVKGKLTYFCNIPSNYTGPGYINITYGGTLHYNSENLVLPIIKNTTTTSNNTSNNNTSTINNNLITNNINNIVTNNQITNNTSNNITMGDLISDDLIGDDTSMDYMNTNNLFDITNINI